jgi:DNA invertase Pin-like site-specific DNA recombinase
MLRAGLYARVSTNDQQTLAMQNRAMREYAARRGWKIALQVREVNSGAAARREGPRKYWKPPVAGRSIWCWCGGWTAGADR